MSDKRKYVGILCVLIVLVWLLASCSPSATLPKPTDTAPVHTPVLTADMMVAERMVPESMALLTEKGFLALYADTENGEFAVEDRRTGRLWYSNPVDRTEDTDASGAMKNWLSSQLLVNTIVDETKTVKSYNSYVSCTKRDGVTVELTEDGFKVNYTFVKEFFTIPVYYTLLEDSLHAEIRAEEIREEGEIRILSITLLPMLGAQGKSEEGFILLGNGSGGVIDFNNGKTEHISAYRAPIYGSDAVSVLVQQQNKTEETLLPVFGLSAGDHGMLAICDEGAGQGYLNAAASGLQTGYNTASFEFELRITQLVTVGSDDGNGRDVITLEKTTPTGHFGVRYFFLNEASSGLAGLADVTAAYFRTQGVPSRAVPEQAPLYLTVLGAVRYPSSVAGFRVDVTRTMTSYEQAASMLQSLAEKQVSGVRMIYDGWSRSELEGKITVSDDPVKELGSDKERDALKEALAAQGGSLILKASTVQYLKSGNGYSTRSDSIRDVLRSVVEIPFYKRNTFFADNDRDTGRMLCIGQSAQAFLQLTEALPEVSISTGDYGSTLYTDYGGGVYKRHQAETLAAQTLKAASSQRTLIGDAPHAYALSALSEAVNLPSTTTYYPVVDRAVPFTQLVLRQLMPCGSQPLNQSGSPTRDFLRCIAAGVAPHYEVSSSSLEGLKSTDETSYYGADFANLEATIVAQYAQWAALYAQIKDAHVVSYTETNGVVKTVYDNGVYTLVNTTAESVTVDNTTITAEDFVVKGGSVS